MPETMSFHAVAALAPVLIAAPIHTAATTARSAEIAIWSLYRFAVISTPVGFIPPEYRKRIQRARRFR